MPKLFKKGDVCVLVDPVTKNRIWLPLEDVEIKHGGRTLKLGELIKELDDNKVSKAEFDKYKLNQKKILKQIINILKINAGQTEVNSLDLNELLDTFNNVEEK